MIVFLLDPTQSSLADLNSGPDQTFTRPRQEPEEEDLEQVMEIRQTGIGVEFLPV